MQNKIAPLLIIFAACLWGLLGIFVRRFNEFGVESMSIVFIRAVLTSPMAAIIAAVTDVKQLKLRLRDIWVFAGMGLLSIIFFNYCYFTAISMMSISVAAILLYTAPVFVMILSAVIYKEKITVRKMAAMAVIMVGLVLVTGVYSGGFSVTPAGVLYGLGSALGYGMYSIFNRAAIDRGYKPLAVTAWGFAFAALFSVFFADMGAIGQMVSVRPSMVGFAVLFAAVTSAAPYIMYSAGLKYTETGKAAIYSSIEPAAAAVFGMIFCNEKLTVPAVLGTGMILAASALCSSPTDKEKS